MPPPLDRIPPEIVAVADYEALARERMSEAAWAYVAGGAADELTLRENRAAFDRIKLLPRVLRPLAGGHTRVRLGARTFEHPILVAPTAWHTLVHAEGERATALGAAAARAGLVVSAQAGVALEEIAMAGGGSPWWLQLYPSADRAVTALGHLYRLRRFLERRDLLPATP